MHRLLIRQLQRHLGKDFLPDEKWQLFLHVISGHYEAVEQERALLENALGVNSQELTEANERFQTQAQQERTLLRSVIDSIPDPIFFKTTESVYLGCNKAFEKYLGLPESAIIGKTDFDFVESTTAAFSQKRDMEMLDQNQPSLSEEWITYPDGERECLEVLRTPYSSVDGKQLGLIGIGRNITKRKKLEDEMRIASLVFRNSEEGMLVTDANNRIVSINPACSKITGYTLDELAGKDPKILSSGRHEKDFYRSMWHALDTTCYWRGEIQDRRKNGDIYTKSLTINTLLNEERSVQGYIALFSDISEKKQSEERIWRQTNFDMLTGLPNRRMFRDRLEQEIKKQQSAGCSMALLFIDLDNFKEINDALGHLAGDDLLVEAGRRITASVRKSDTVARLGGDEFTVLLTELVYIRNVETIAQSIIDKLAEPFLLGKEMVHASASIGITLYPADATDVEELFKNADQAMYLAKSQGRNRFSYFTHALQEAAQSRLRIVNDLHGALAANQFMVYFQPIVNLATGDIHKAEALIRWQHPERGMISPAEFIPLAEETGLIVEIGDWVFRESARWASMWEKLSVDGFQISVNVSPVQFRTKGYSQEESWLAYLNELGISGKNIAIEITEGLLLNANSHIAGKLLQYRNVGIQMAIDDFGTGYSSLAYLKKFDIDYLKIDQSFVRNLTTDANDRALSEAIIVMAHKLGLKVIAEGVETEEQKAFLTAAGCDYAQGYLYSRPIPPEKFEEFLKQHLGHSRNPSTGYL